MIQAPPEVHQALKELIDENFDGKRSVFPRTKFIERVLSKVPTATESEILLNIWMDVGFQFQPEWSYRFHGSLIPGQHKFEFVKQ